MATFYFGCRGFLCRCVYRSTKLMGPGTHFHHRKINTSLGFWQMSVFCLAFFKLFWVPKEAGLCAQENGAPLSYKEWMDDKVQVILSIRSSDYPDYFYPGKSIHSNKKLLEMCVAKRLMFHLQLPWKLNSTFSSFISISSAKAGREANYFWNVQLCRHAGIFSTWLCDG